MEKTARDLEVKEGVSIERKEVWHNKENLKICEALDNGCCGGVPFFYNTETKKFVCGECPYDELKEWAKDSARSA